MPGLLPRAQRRRIQCPFSLEAANNVAAFGTSASTPLCPRPWCFSLHAISPG
jgi:hypothetical protein